MFNLKALESTFFLDRRRVPRLTCQVSFILLIYSGSPLDCSRSVEQTL